MPTNLASKPWPRSVCFSGGHVGYNCLGSVNCDTNEITGTERAMLTVVKETGEENKQRM